MEIKLISLIIPAYRQEKTIAKDVRNIDQVLSSLPYKHEIIVVVDGYLDKTMDNLKRLKNIDVKALGYETNAGKGFAVKYGMARAKGDVIGFIDAGMEINPEEVSLMIDMMKSKKADIIIGSKLHPDSKVNYPRFRHFLSLIGRLITKILFQLNIKDTQVGLKIFRRPVAKSVFSKIIVKRFAFDIEVLVVAKRLGYDRIYEAPVKLNFRQGSITYSNFWKIYLYTLWETLAVFYRLKIVHYYDK